MIEKIRPKAETEDMFKAIEEKVALRKAKDPFFNIFKSDLEAMIKESPDRFYGIIEGETLIRTLALNLRHLRQKLGLPENPPKRF